MARAINHGNSRKCQPGDALPRRTMLQQLKNPISTMPCRALEMPMGIQGLNRGRRGPRGRSCDFSILVHSRMEVTGTTGKTEQEPSESYRTGRGWARKPRHQTTGYRLPHRDARNFPLQSVREESCAQGRSDVVDGATHKKKRDPVTSPCFWSQTTGKSRGPFPSPQAGASSSRSRTWSVHF